MCEKMWQNKEKGEGEGEGEVAPPPYPSPKGRGVDSGIPPSTFELWVLNIELYDLNSEL